MATKLKTWLGEMWWMWMMFAIVSIIFGITTLIWPGMTLATMVMMVGGWFLIWGVIELIQGLRRVFKEISALWSVLGGIALIGLGVFLARHPGMTFAVLALTLGWTLIVRSIYDLAVTRQIDKDGSVWWIISSIIGLLAGIGVLVHPVSGSLAFTWVIGLYALVNGGVIAARAGTSLSCQGSRRRQKEVNRLLYEAQGGSCLASLFLNIT